jgi:putative endonuclease
LQTIQTLDFNESRILLRCFVYVLGSADQHGCRTYVGWTVDPDRRLVQHNSGTGARSTRGRTWTLLYLESYATKREAMSREWHLKRDRALRKHLAKGIPSFITQ